MFEITKKILIFIALLLAKSIESSVEVDKRALNNKHSNSVFDLPDLLLEWGNVLNRETYQLSAYSSIHNEPILADRCDEMRWVSLGRPQLVKTLQHDEPASLFHFNDEGFYMHINTLMAQHKNILAERASQKYQCKISPHQIIRMPLIKFTCSLNIVYKENHFSVNGQVYNFESYPLRIDFLSRYNETDLLKRRIDRDGAKLDLKFDCLIRSLDKNQHSTSETFSRSLALYTQNSEPLQTDSRPGPAVCRLFDSYLTPDKTKCIKRFPNETCNIDEECTSNLECINHVCKCTSTQYWDKNAQKCYLLPLTFGPRGGERVFGMCQLVNGDVASGSYDGIKIWDVYYGTNKMNIKTNDAPVLALTTLQNGDLASSSMNGTITIWDTTTWTVKRTMEKYIPIWLLFNLPNGAFASVSDFRGIIKIWDSYTGELRMTLSSNETLTASTFTAVAFSNGNVAASYDTEVKIWTTTTGKVIKSFKGSDYIRSMAVLPNADGNSAQEDLACGSSSPTGDDGTITIRIWDVVNGIIRKTMSSTSTWSNFGMRLAALPNGDLAMRTHGRVEIWNVVDGSIKNVVFTDGNTFYPYSLVTLSSGGLVAVTNDDVIRIWTLKEN